MLAERRHGSGAGTTTRPEHQIHGRACTTLSILAKEKVFEVVLSGEHTPAASCGIPASDAASRCLVAIGEEQSHLKSGLRNLPLAYTLCS